MSAPLSATSPASVLAALGIGGAGQGGRPPEVNQNARVTDDSNPSLLPVARLMDFHCVLIMTPSPERDALSMSLWDTGMIVTTFASLHEAEGVLVGEAVHCVLIDARLGPNTASHLVWWLHAVGRGGVRVAVFGTMTPEQQSEARLGGVALCLPAPHQPAAFARQLGTALGFEPVSWRRSR